MGIFFIFFTKHVFYLYIYIYIYIYIYKYLYTINVNIYISLFICDQLCDIGPY